MDKSDIFGKAKRETNKRACMVDMTIKTLDSDAPYSLDCEAAGNGTRIMLIKHSQDLPLIMLQTLKKLSLQEKALQKSKP